MVVDSMVVSYGGCESDVWRKKRFLKSAQFLKSIVGKYLLYGIAV